MRMLKSYNFWIRLVAVLILFVRIVASRFGIEVDSAIIMDIATAIAGVLVVLGVIEAPAVQTEKEQNEGEITMENITNNIKNDLIEIKEKLLKMAEEYNLDELPVIGGEIAKLIEREEQKEIGEVVNAETVDEVEEIVISEVEQVKTEPAVEVVDQAVYETVAEEKTSDIDEEIKEKISNKIRSILESSLDEILSEVMG